MYLHTYRVILNDGVKILMYTNIYFFLFSFLEEPVTYDDMPFIEAKVGTTGGYVCYNITDVTELTLISMNEEVLNQFETVSVLVRNNKYRRLFYKNDTCRK